MYESQSRSPFTYWTKDDSEATLKAPRVSFKYSSWKLQAFIRHLWMPLRALLGLNQLPFQSEQHNMEPWPRWPDCHTLEVSGTFVIKWPATVCVCWKLPLRTDSWNGTFSRTVFKTASWWSYFHSDECKTFIWTRLPLVDQLRYIDKQFK